jgi:hypothetical protein
MLEAMLTGALTRLFRGIVGLGIASVAPACSSSSEPTPIPSTNDDADASPNDASVHDDAAETSTLGVPDANDGAADASEAADVTVASDASDAASDASDDADAHWYVVPVK